MNSQVKSYFLENRYIRSILQQGGSVSPNDLGSSGTMILSRYPCQYYECEFESSQGRSLILAEPCTPKNLILASSQLESHSNTLTRIKQL